MICRCSSPEQHSSRAVEQAHSSARSTEKYHKEQIKKLKDEIAGLTLSADSFEILDAFPIEEHLVLKVKYPSCKNCEFEGVKVMVFLNATAIDALRWRRIDPHFRVVKKPYPPGEAPPPAARYPNTANGWCDAQAYARGKCK